MKPIDTESAIKMRYQEPVCMVVYQDEDGRVNVTPAGWSMLCNSKPRCWAVSLYNQHYSNEIIKKTGEFVYCIPSYKQREAVAYCGSVSGRDVNKLDNCDLRTIPSKLIKPPLIEDCIACFECKVISQAEAPDHTIFVGEVLQSYVSGRDDKMYNLGQNNFVEWKIEGPHKLK